jgi:GNAT superfamily N-acetyltransferase
MSDKAVLMGEHRAKFPDNRMRSIGSDYYEWKIYRNPIMEGEIYLETRDSLIVGSSTAMPRKLAILDEALLGAELGDSFTRPEYRRQGINWKALKGCMDYALSHGMNVIYGPPNEANYRIHIKLGFLPCTYIDWALLTKSLKPIALSFRLFAKMMMGRDVRKSYRHLGFLVRTGTAKEAAVPRGGNGGKNGFQVLKIDQFGDTVDPLWGKPRYSFFISRDGRYLNWRYFENPDKFTVLAALKGEEYLGYVAVKTTKDNVTGIMCDFVTVDDRSDVFVGLVKKAEEILRKNGAKVINLRCIADSPYYNELRKMGYYDPGPDKYQPVLVYGGTEVGKRILETPGKWHFTYGDTDEV